MILSNPLNAGEGDMLTPLEKAQRLLANQQLVALLWQCYMRGGAPSYNPLWGTANCGIPDGRVRPANVWEPNNRNLGVVQGWTLEQIVADWNRYIRGQTIEQGLSQFFAGTSAQVTDIATIEGIRQGLFFPNNWPQIVPSRRAGLMCWFIYASNQRAQVFSQVRIQQATPTVGTGAGKVFTSPKTAAPQADSASAWATVAGWTRALGAAPAGNAAGGMVPDPVGNAGYGVGGSASGGMSTVVTDGSAGSGYRAADYGLQASGLNNLVAKLGKGSTVYDISYRGGFGSTDDSEPEVVEPIVEPNLPAPPSAEVGLAETQALAARVYASPADTAARIIDDQSRIDLNGALLAGGAAAPAWQAWAGEAWRSETRAAMGGTAYDATGGDWGALLACFGVSGITSQQYMQWLLQVVEVVRTRLQSAPTPTAKKKSGGLFVPVAIGVLGLGIAVARSR